MAPPAVMWPPRLSMVCVRVRVPSARWGTVGATGDVVGSVAGGGDGGRGVANRGRDCWGGRGGGRRGV